MPPEPSACFVISTPPPLLRLKLEKFSRVFVAGLATNYCCKFTAIDTKRAGFIVMLLPPHTRGVGGPFDPQPTVQELERSGVRVRHDMASLQRQTLVLVHTSFV
jgi:nicotinamidase-related amidase